MKKVIITFLSTILIGISVFAQDRLLWEEGVKLTWDDFQGVPSRVIESPSVSNASFFAESKPYNVVFGKPKYKVQAEFLRNTSWVKESEKTDDHLKFHQLNFDLAEIYARKLKKQLIEEKVKPKNMNNYYTSVFNQFVKEQTIFIEDTNLGRNEEKLNFWEKKIMKELDDLNKYK